MNKAILFPLLLIVAFLHSCNPENNKIEGYEISGQIEGIKDGNVILAKLDLDNNERMNVDSALIENGKFTFKGSVESPYLHTLFINGDSNKIHFFLENSAISIKANIKNLEQAKISGSREDSLFHTYKTDDIFDREKGMEIMLTHPDYSFAAFTAYYQFQIHNIQIDTLDMIVKSFKEPVNKTVYFKHLETLYNTIKKVAISQPAPLFMIPDTEGKMINLDDFKGSYVLIDFWASWCAPCREANPKLVAAYNEFKSKKFTVLGISVDKNKEYWLKAIKQDKLPWINVSNVSGWDEVSNKYGVKAVPQNFLINPAGIIIDKNIEPENLIERLNKLLE